MRKFEAYTSDVILDTDREAFAKCFRNAEKRVSKEGVEYWGVKAGDKTIYVYEWDGKSLYVDKKFKGVIEDEISKCKLRELLEGLSINSETETEINITSGEESDSELDERAKGNLKRLFEDIANLNYGVNKFNEKVHEGNLEALLKKRGFKAISKEEGEKGDFYIKEPNGGQSPPDFRVFSNGEKVDIECKSCQKGYKPMWNASYPDDKIIYVYTNKSDNETLLFTGDEIITEKVREIYERYKTLNKELHKRINNELSELPEKDNPYGMQVYARNMFVQTKHLKRGQKAEYIKKVMGKIRSSIKK